MIITPKFDFVEGSFDTQNVEMLCVPHENHGCIDLSIKESGNNWNFPIAKKSSTLKISMWILKPLLRMLLSWVKK